jgi:nicotinamidase/pyrazinamidase
VDIQFNSSDALLVVDLQYDFLPGGSLGIQEGDQVIPVINTLIEAAKKGHATIIATRDWHTANHVGFKEQGGPWPPHCVRNTHGAQFHEDIQYPANALVVSKVSEIYHEYSAFPAMTDDGQPLPKILEERHIKRVIICGLALDYCVKASSLDAVKLGFETIVALDATRAINTEDGEEAVRVLKSFGVQFI